jgi:hypothetical protein
MKKKSKLGVSPKGAVVLRAREEERRRNLPRPVIITPSAVHREPNPIVGLMREFPVLGILNRDLVVNKELIDIIDGEFHVVFTGHPFPDEKKYDIVIPKVRGLDPPSAHYHTIEEIDHTNSVINRFFETWVKPVIVGSEDK